MITRTNGHHLETGEILEGFLYSYRQLDTNALKVYEALAQLNSLIELLVAKGIIATGELAERKREVEKGLQESFRKAGIGVRVQRSEVDKYKITDEAQVDCDRRKPICRAACCKLAYALTLQDINEGIRWSLGQPFMNARKADGYCVHLDGDTLACSRYQDRPLVCRQYDCRNDHRIWLDFDKMIINPDLFKEGGPDSPGMASA